MKMTISIFLFLSLQLNSLCQNETLVLTQANQLIQDKKYNSAFELLNKYDQKNEIPAIVLLKEEIALNYFVTSIMHQSFGFIDIDKNEDIMDYRGKEGKSNLYMFPINEILEKLIKSFPENYQLYKGLGDFYYEVHLKYGDNWLKNNKELFTLIEKNYEIAFSHNVSDYFSYYVLGYIALSSEKYSDAIPLFIQAITLNPNYPDSFYNLAYAYLYINDRENAIINAKKSYELYSDRVYKADAARMIAVMYDELNDDKKSIEYFELSNSVDSNNYYTLKPLLILYFKTGSEKVKPTTKSFYELAPGNPTIYNDLAEVYFQKNKSSELAEFYKSNLDRYNSDLKITGNLNFYLGRIYFETDKKLSTEYFLKAKEIFSKIYDRNHEIFIIIDEALETLK